MGKTPLTECKTKALSSEYLTKGSLHHEHI